MPTASDRREELAIWKNITPHIMLHVTQYIMQHVMQYIIRSSIKIVRDRLGRQCCEMLDF